MYFFSQKIKKRIRKTSWFSLPLSLYLPLCFFLSTTDADALIMIYLCRITYEYLQRPVDAEVTEY